MKKLSTAIILTVLLTVSGLAQDKGFGVGFILGNPTGLSLKAWQTKTTAIDAAVAWSFGKYDALEVHADYLIHNYSIISVAKGRLPLYYGLGASGVFASEFALGIRGVVGLDYMFATVPLDVFLELVPSFQLVPKTDFYFDAGIGMRYFF